MEYRTTNPANRKSVTRALGKQPPPKNYPAAEYKDLGGYLAQIRDSKYGWAPRYWPPFFLAQLTAEYISAPQLIDLLHKASAPPPRRM